MDAAALTARTIAVREPSLDDVFLSLTGRPAEEGASPDGQQDTGTSTRKVRRRRKEHA